jgi:copper chaperone NosL
MEDVWNPRLCERLPLDICNIARRTPNGAESRTNMSHSAVIHEQNHTVGTVTEDGSKASVTMVQRLGLTLPRIVLFLSTTLFAISHIWKYWELRLNAPQYPGGLFVSVFTHDVRGDVSEVDGLNHYIGMAPLAEAAEIERALAPFAVVAFIVLGLVAVFLRKRWSSLLTIPIILFPIVVFVDLFIWLYYFGHSLDPTAALSGAIDEFTPAILGRGTVGQFTTDAVMGLGWWIGVVAAILAIVAIILSYRKESGTT